MFSIEQIVSMVNGDLLQAERVSPVRIWHDSRSIRSGDLFVALPGVRTDGHRFLPEAYGQGACAAIVRDSHHAPPSARNLIVVADPLSALHTLATAWRRQFACPIIGITGSNGKTTVKTLLAHLLSGTHQAYAAPGNFNTEIGLPIALLNMPADTEVGVFELGTEAPGEIEVLARILQPDLAILTAIGPSHFATFGSYEAVANEKWTLVSSLSPSAIALVNADSEPLRRRAEGAEKCVQTVGFEHGSLRGKILQAVPRLRIDAWGVPIECGLMGRHNAANGLLASVAAYRLGLSPATIAKRAESFRPVTHRLVPVSAPFGTILDDTYNANPASTDAALRVLAEWGDSRTQRVFVFGEMLDLGEGTEQFHREIAALAFQLGVDTVIPVGDRPTAACELEAGIITVNGDPQAAVLRCLESDRDSVVLVKGSRALQLERLVKALADPA